MLNENNYMGGADYFSDEGTYYYTVLVYSCDTITSTLNKDCFEVDKKELDGVKPLKTVTKAINVKGRVNIPECKTNDDCTKTCVGCKYGTQLCEWTIEKCIDCSTDWDCKSNYKCVNNSCIFWECETNGDCNDGDISTKDMCIEHKCSHTKITECIDNDLYCPEGCDVDTDNDCTDKCGSKIIDCGATIISIISEETMGDKPNLDCFIDAARDCCPAKLVTETEMNLFGPIIYSKTYREIKGLQEERCVLYQRTDDGSYSYPEKMRKQMLDSGMTEEEINQQLEESNEVAQDMIGKDSTCKYPIEDLIDILEGEKEGSFSFSTENVEKYQCTGSMYGPYEYKDCPSCENCVSGSTKQVMTQEGDELVTVCYECTSNSDCKEGFHCFDHICLSNDILKDNPPCEGFDGHALNDLCKEYACETCEEGHMVCQGGWSSWPSDVGYKCIECDDFSKKCVEGYVCKEYECVPE